ncbi:MAG: cation transporter [Methylococcaceae bacterium]|nr:cation transporter [Methylococcaceae bacterium]
MPYHHHAHSSNQGRIFLLTILLNALFVGVEFFYGLISNSTALIADAGHNVSDVLGLFLAWFAVILSRKQPSKRYTYGLRSTSILAALANTMLLLVACGAIGWEAIHRVSQPPIIAGQTVSIVAAVGIFINGLSAILLMKGSKGDLNIRGAYLHMVADTAVSLAVVITGLVMFYTQWYLIDPIMSLIIVLVILVGTWGLLRDSLRLALNAVPRHIDASAINDYLCQLEGVSDIHDLHIWGLSTTENALTVHLVMPNGHPGDDFMDEITHTLEECYEVHHSTLQIELGTTNHTCSLTEAKHSHDHSYHHGHDHNH